MMIIIVLIPFYHLVFSKFIHQHLKSKFKQNEYLLSFYYFIDFKTRFHAKSVKFIDHETYQKLLLFKVFKLHIYNHLTFLLESLILIKSLILLH